MSDELIRELAAAVSELAFRVAEGERRTRNMMRYARVTEVDPKKGVVKVVDEGGGEGKDLPSDWLPWMEQGGPQEGGNATTWRPPRVGQRVVWFAPSGNLAEGMIMSGGFSDQAKQPSEDGSAHVETNGNSSVTITPGGITYKATRIDLNP